MFLSTQPLWMSVVIFGLATLAAMLGPIAVRRAVDLQRLTTNNEIAGFKFATVGVLYAVLLGFAVIVVWEKFSDAETDVTQEAGAAAAMYRLANGVRTDAGSAIREAVTHYLQAAVVSDWPAMMHGKPSPEVSQALDNLYTQILQYRPTDGHGTVVLQEFLHQLDLITDARRARLVLAAGIVPGSLTTLSHWPG